MKFKSDDTALRNRNAIPMTVKFLDSMKLDTYAKSPNIACDVTL